MSFIFDSFDFFSAVRTNFRRNKPWYSCKHLLCGFLPFEIAFTSLIAFWWESFPPGFKAVFLQFISTLSPFFAHLPYLTALMYFFCVYLRLKGVVAFSSQGDRIALTQIEQMINGRYEKLGYYDTQQDNLTWLNMERWSGGKVSKNINSTPNNYYYNYHYNYIQLLPITSNYYYYCYY